MNKPWDVIPVLSGFLTFFVALAIVLFWLFSDAEPPPVTLSASPVETPPAALPAPVPHPAPPPVADPVPPPPSSPSAAAPVNDPRAASADWARLTRDAIEMPVRIHFPTGTTTPAAQALPDLERLADYLKRQYPHGRLRVLGFSDAGGSEPGNVRLSRQRAESVTQALQRQGLTVEDTAGLGSQAPLAANDTAANRDRNRRVEVWVRPE